MKNIWHWFSAPANNAALILCALALAFAPLLAGDTGAGGADLTALGASNFDVIQTADGSASEPGHGFTDDTNNGLYRVGTDNVGLAAGGTLVSDWTATSLDQNALPIVNIGSASTDFDASGGLTLAGYLTVTGNLSTTGALNMGNSAISNIGNSGTDFSASGGLTLANALTVTTGGISVTAGGASIVGGLTLTNTAFSGAVRFGSVSAVVSGTTITHGLGGTPTSVMLTPVITNGVVLSQTVYVISADATSIVIGMQISGADALATVYWMAGR